MIGGAGRAVSSSSGAEALEHHHEAIRDGVAGRSNTSGQQIPTAAHNAQFAELKSEKRRLANSIPLSEACFNGIGANDGELLSDPE